MALFDRFRVSPQELERRLGRPLGGDPGRGEKGLIAALVAGRLVDVRRALDRDQFAPDFKAAVDEYVQEGASRWEAFKTWQVAVPLPVWDEYARESRLSRVSVSQCLSAAIQRDYRRRREAADSVDTLARQLAGYQQTAAQLLDQAGQLTARLGQIQDLNLRLARVEQALSGRSGGR